MFLFYLIFLQHIEIVASLYLESFKIFSPEINWQRFLGDMDESTDYK